MKTIREWFEELPEPYRTDALDNMEDAEKSVKSMSDAIDYSFVWSRTEQGHDYWSSLRETYHVGYPDAPSFSSPSPHRLFEQIAEYVDKHDLKTYKILVRDGVAELITED